MEALESVAIWKIQSKARAYHAGVALQLIVSDSPESIAPPSLRWKAVRSSSVSVSYSSHPVIAAGSWMVTSDIPVEILAI
jgi:hypothetical protein